MFAKKLSVLLLGLVALPSAAAARPAARHDDSRPAATDRARAETGRDHKDVVGPLKGMCERLECTDAQLTAIRSIARETRERLAAERDDHRELFEHVKELRKGGLDDEEIALLRAEIAIERSQAERLIDGAVLGISNVLDDHQRELFLAMVEKAGAKAVLGAGGRSAKGKSFAARTKMHEKRKHERKLAKAERKRHSAKA